MFRVPGSAGVTVSVTEDHGKLKRLIKPTLGFKTMKTAYATLKRLQGHALMKGQARPWQLQSGIAGEVRLVERTFSFGDNITAEVQKFVEREWAAPG